VDGGVVRYLWTESIRRGIYATAASRKSVHRAFTNGVHNPLQAMVLDRVKYQLGYPEAARTCSKHKGNEQGTAREYLEDCRTQHDDQVGDQYALVRRGFPPPGFEQSQSLVCGAHRMNEACRLSQSVLVLLLWSDVMYDGELIVS
jgi:hypothetical protein